MKLTASAIEGFVKALLWKDFDEPSPIPEFHKELWELCCSDASLVAIGAPRGHAKSTAVSFVYTLAAVLFREAKFVLLVSDTEAQAILFLDQIKTALQSNKDLIEIFGIKDFESDNKSDIIVKMSDGHRFRIMAKGSEQKVRGLIWDHQRPDLIIGDDLENDEIVMNDERREKFRLWMIKALLPCRAPRGKVRIVGTVLHLDSFLARILPLEGERDVVEDNAGLRFVFDPSSKRGKNSMFKSILYKAHIGSLPSYIRDSNDILWKDHKYYTKAWFQDKYQAAVDIGHPEGYAQEYLNRPLDETLAFFRRSDLIPMSGEDRDAIVSGRRPLKYFAGGDLAITEKEKADYTAFIVVGMDSDNMMYVMDVVRERMDSPTIVKTILDLQKRWNLGWFALEQEKIMKSVMPFLREQMLKTSEIVNVIPIIPSTDKRSRAASIQGRMRIGGVKIAKDADWYPTFESEFVAFDKGKHDDQVDAFSCIGLALQKLDRGNTYEEDVEESRRQLEEISQIGNDGRNAYTGY